MTKQEFDPRVENRCKACERLKNKSSCGKGSECCPQANGSPDLWKISVAFKAKMKLRKKSGGGGGGMEFGNSVYRRAAHCFG